MKSEAEIMEAYLLINLSTFFLPDGEEKDTAAVTAKGFAWALGFDDDLDRVLTAIRKSATKFFEGAETVVK